MKGGNSAGTSAIQPRNPEATANVRGGAPGQEGPRIGPSLRMRRLLAEVKRGWRRRWCRYRVAVSCVCRREACGCSLPWWDETEARRAGARPELGQVAVAIAGGGGLSRLVLSATGGTGERFTRGAGGPRHAPLLVPPVVPGDLGSALSPPRRAAQTGFPRRARVGPAARCPERPRRSLGGQAVPVSPGGLWGTARGLEVLTRLGSVVGWFKSR